MPSQSEIAPKLLEKLSGGNLIKKRDFTNYISNAFKLSDDLRDLEFETKKKGTVLNDRIAWALNMLFNDDLVHRPNRGVYQITLKGESSLGNKKQSFNLGITTPTEDLKSSYQKIKNAMCAEILEQVISKSWRDFEHLIAEVMESMEYGETEVGHGSNDKGIDGVVYVDKLRLNLIGLQAKKYRSKSIGRPELQSFSGSLDGRNTEKVFFSQLLHLQERLWIL